MAAWVRLAKCCKGCCSRRLSRSAVTASRSPIANPRCRNSCKGRGEHRRNIASLERAAPTIKRFSKLKFGLTASAWRQARAARKKKRSNALHGALWDNSNAQKRKAETECRQKQYHKSKSRRRKRS